MLSFDETQGIFSSIISLFSYKSKEEEKRGQEMAESVFSDTENGREEE